MLYFKRKIVTLTMSIMIMASSVNVMAMSGEKAKAKNPNVKNVIVLIADGMSVDGVTLTRWYNSYDAATGKVDTSVKLALDDLASGLTRDYWEAEGVVGPTTDSAPGGTALATGIKSKTGYVGVNDKKAPVATVLEAAKNKGKATGLISTSQIMHATPADFSSHYPNRGKEFIIAEQQVYNNIDVVFGGGFGRLTDRDDKEDLVKVLKDKGYNYVTDKEAFDKITSKTWAMFAKADMAYEMDRAELKPEQPSLSEMTKKAIDVLSQDKDGFFLMVEGSKVDWAAHANDPVGVISDINAYDDAVEVALNYAKKNNDTMIIALTDHGNGGLTIGNADTTSTYDKDPVSKYIAPLKKAKLTGEGIATKFNTDKSNIKEVMETYFGITDLTEDEEKELKETKSVQAVAGKIISKRAFLGWTTGGHTGEDTVLYTYLPNDERITGTLDNTDIAKIISGMWGIDLTAETEKYFVEAKTELEAKGATVIVDNTDENNVKMIAKKGTSVLTIYENKNVVDINGQSMEVPSVNVNVDGTFYVNQQVINFIK